MNPRNSLRIGLCFNIDVLLLQRYKTALSQTDVLIFPELADGGYAAITAGKKPHTLADGFITLLKNASKEFRCTIVAGSAFLKDGTPRPTNTSLVFSKGKLIHRYDKIHLFSPTGDTKFFQRGIRASTFDFTGTRKRIRAGVVICYDLRFPELVRVLALKGMNILFVPARWPLVRDIAWQTLLKARAIENQTFVVGCNAQDAEGGFSYVVDPMGDILFTTRTAKQKPLSILDIDLGRLDKARQLHRNLNDAVVLKQLLRKI